MGTDFRSDNEKRLSRRETLRLAACGAAGIVVSGSLACRVFAAEPKKADEQKLADEKAAKDKSGPDIYQAVEHEYAYQSRETDSARNNAKVYYLLGLIAKNRLDDAVALSKRMEAEEFHASEFEKRWHSFDKNRLVKVGIGDSGKQSLHYKYVGIIS